MTRDLVNESELAHDTSGADPTPFMQAALDSIVDDLMSGEKVRGLAWGLHSFVFDQPDLHELVAAAIITSDYAAMKAEIEKRLRATFEDADVTHDLAAQMASEPDEQS